MLSKFVGHEIFGANLEKLEQNNIDTIWLKMMAIDILALFAENLVLSLVMFMFPVLLAIPNWGTLEWEWFPSLVFVVFPEWM